MSTPLKLDGSGGDLKEMTTGEENWLAYQASLQLAEMDGTDVGALTTSSGGTSIGSYSNTFFNEAVGTHPGTSITSGTTTTTLYQNTGTAAETSADFHRAIQWDGTGDHIEEQNDTSMNTLVDRLLATAFGNGYPGHYYLASSSPGVAYDTHAANVFSDTRADGTNVVYNLYQRQSIGSAPTEVKSIKLRDANGNLQEMTNTEIKVTFGQRMKTRIMSSANNIGAYQLRSSAQGAPTDPGTWTAYGTATDTKQTLGDQNYSANYTQGFTGNFIGNFIGNYSGTYARTRITTYIGNYVNPNAVQYTRISIRRSSAGQPTAPTRYIGNFLGNFLGPKTFIGNYVGNFVGNYTGAYTRDTTIDYTQVFTGDFVGNYDGQTILSGSQTIETYTLYCRTA